LLTVKERQKMANTPKKPEDAFSEITNDFKKVFGDDLVSIILYGSGAGSNYLPGKSDLNFLIVLSEQGIDNLDRAIDVVSKWKKKNVAIPLFMTKSYINSSLDSYPIEFLNMQKNYIKVFGEDVLKELSFDSGFLRLQCEKELKGKILHLREGFLETEGKDKRIRNLVKISLTAFVSIFKALLYLVEAEIPGDRREVIKSVAEKFEIDADVFLKCADIKEDKGSFSSSETKEIFKAYLMEVRKLSGIVDKF
jgi:predicted nucleotidyltransferase